MNQYIYLLKNERAASEIYKLLAKAPLLKNNVHFVSHAKQPNPKLPKYNFFIESDAIHSGVLGAIAGFGISGLLITLLELSNILTLPAVVVIGIGLFSILFGSWLGGFIGFQKENYRYHEFKSELDQGEVLLIIDCPANAVKQTTFVMKQFENNIHKQIQP
ncbi:hypothetical protein [Paraferrimonas sp. SM1919]|uniref:hypothetical protein n=1 Tax=Paraferrimonas sp. SM1919 TaxID=2662263 RepID=UPI0013D37415|nr:hypothetical protein [Paraferrimonas sp. SM1919]